MASGIDDFYKGARIEMVNAKTKKMQAWWADIEEYDAFSKLAMFRKWNKPYGKESDPADVPSKGDTYRIFLEPQMRGQCRDPVKPKVRMGPPCEQQQVFEIGTVVSKGPSKLRDTVDAKSSDKTCLDGSPYDKERCGKPGKNHDFSLKKLKESEFVFNLPLYLCLNPL